MGPTEGKCGSRLTWALDGEGVLTIAGIGEMNNYTSSGGAPWELRKSSIVRTVVGSGVTSVGNYAFYNCPNLAEVSLPAGLRRLGERCLYNCDVLTEIALPEGLYEIGNYAFYDSDGLTAVSLPDSLTSLGTNAFLSCDHLASVRLSEGLAGIPSSAFQGSALTVVTIPEGVTQIGSYAFSSCRQLRELRLPSTLEGIGSGAFDYCESLETILYTGTREDAAAIRIGTSNIPLTTATWRFLPDLTNMTVLRLPARLKVIEAEAFTGLACEAIVIPEGCTNIGSRAFAGCANLVYVRIPASVSSIAEDAFADCPLVEIDWVGH